MELQGYLSWHQQTQYDKQAIFQYNVGESLTILEFKNTNHVCQENGLWRKSFWVHSLTAGILNSVAVSEWIKQF